MPLKCLNNNQPIYSFDFNEDECKTAPMTAGHILAQLHIIDGVKRTN